jgi:drug/metabolite transporter (DMT)-like permease
MSSRIYLILFIALLSVSTSSIFARYLPDVSAVVIAFWRLSIASVLIWIYATILKQPQIKRTDFKYYIVSGFFLALHFTSFYQAVKLTSIANATLLGITAPMFTILYEKLFLKIRLKPLVLIGLLFAAVGSIIITGTGILSSSETFAGQLFGLIASFCIAMVYIAAKHLRGRSNTIVYTKFLYSYGAIFLFVFTLFSCDSVINITQNDILWLLALGIIPTILGHSLFYYSIKFTSPTTIAAVPIGEPVIASIFAWLIFSEIISLATTLGGVFILIGVYFLATRQQS